MDNKKLFVGNLQWETTEDILREVFGEFGTVEEATIVMDRPMDDRPARPRGFAFVTMSTEAEANAAIEGVNNREVDGRKLIVNHARPKEQSDRRPSGGFNRGGNGGFQDRGSRY